MAYNNEYPHTDPYLYNADWMLKKIKEIEEKIGQESTHPSQEGKKVIQLDSAKLQELLTTLPGLAIAKKLYNNEKLHEMSHRDFYNLWDGTMFRNMLFMSRETLGTVPDVGDIYCYHWTLRAQSEAEDETDPEHARVQNYQMSHEQLEKIVIISGQHGDEKMNMIALWFLFDAWSKEEGTLGAWLLNNFSFDIIPCANPSGIDRNTRRSWRIDGSTGEWVLNADINRSWVTGYNESDLIDPEHPEAGFKIYPTEPTQEESRIIFNYLKTLKPFVKSSPEEEVPEGWIEASNLKSTFVIDSHDYKYSYVTNYPVLIRTASNDASIREESLKYSTMLYDAECEKYPEFRVNPYNARVIRWNSNTLSSPRTLLNTASHFGFKSLLIETPRARKTEEVDYDEVTWDLAIMNISTWLTYAAESVTEQNQLTRIRDLAYIGFYSQMKSDGVGVGHQCGQVPASLDEVVRQMPKGSYYFEYQYQASILVDFLPGSKIGWLEIYKDYGTGTYVRALLRFTDLNGRVYVARYTGTPGTLQPWLPASGVYHSVAETGADVGSKLSEVIEAMAPYTEAYILSSDILAADRAKSANEMIHISKLDTNQHTTVHSMSHGSNEASAGAFTDSITNYNILTNASAQQRWKSLT